MKNFRIESYFTAKCLPAILLIAAVLGMVPNAVLAQSDQTIHDRAKTPMTNNTTTR